MRIFAGTNQNQKKTMFYLVYPAPDLKNFLGAARRLWCDFGLLHRHEQFADYRLESSRKSQEGKGAREDHEEPGWKAIGG